MSGNPDVLEYYRSKNSKKPIRIIDLKECEVETPSGQLRIKRDFNGKHLFVVKTSSRIFYLVAKTEVEMNDWINNISQICHFGSLDDAGKYRAKLSPVQRCIRGIETSRNKKFWSRKKANKMSTQSNHRGRFLTSHDCSV